MKWYLRDHSMMGKPGVDSPVELLGLRRSTPRTRDTCKERRDRCWL